MNSSTRRGGKSRGGKFFRISGPKGKGDFEEVVIENAATIFAIISLWHLIGCLIDD